MFSEICAVYLAEFSNRNTLFLNCFTLHCYNIPFLVAFCENQILSFV
jgi:hypothetical protein